jgi:hypothetical protein
LVGRAFSGSLRSWPHLPQKLNSDGLEDLHCGQMLSNFVPHLPQNASLKDFQTGISGISF